MGLPLIGRQVDVYRILSLLGSGGMAEVYRARDTRLGRDVAIKFLPAHVTADPDRLARFEREARVLASLNHPHIGAIHGIEESNGVKALVLELIEGGTLADRIAKASARGPRALNKEWALHVDEASKRHIMAASINQAGTSVQVGPPKALFKPRMVGRGTNFVGRRRQYDVAPDGRFVVNAETEETNTAPITVILNWQAPPERP